MNNPYATEEGGQEEAVNISKTSTELMHQRALERMLEMQGHKYGIDSRDRNR